MQNLKEHLDKFAGKKVLVLGDVFIDEYVYGDCNRISPEAPVPIFLIDPNKPRVATLGGAGNTAANVKSLGGEAILIGRAGNDNAGEFIAGLCKKQGIDYTGVPQAGPTTRKTRMVAQRQQLMRIDREVVEPSGKLTEEIVLALFRKALPKADIVVLSDYAKGFFTEGMTQTLIREIDEAGKQSVVDPKPQHTPFYRGCSYVTPNVEEYRGMQKTLGTGFADEFCQELDCALLLTQGAEGLAFQEYGCGILRAHTTPKEAFDVSGAGDTVVAAFALSLAAGFDIRTTMELANLAAGIAVTKFGTYAVTKEDMLNA
jgi:D-beta-D-heptose 7-phosphate kinase/D-beta-D-heptose 1-phosphate adenosyltransferase